MGHCRNVRFNNGGRCTTKGIQIKMKQELNVSGEQHITSVINMKRCHFDWHNHRWKQEIISLNHHQVICLHTRYNATLLKYNICHLKFWYPLPTMILTCPERPVSNQRMCYLRIILQDSDGLLLWCLNKVWRYRRRYILLPTRVLDYNSSLSPKSNKSQAWTAPKA